MNLLSVLLVDDDGDALISLARALKAQGLSMPLYAASSAEKALELLRSHSPAVAVVDLSLSLSEGVESGFHLVKKILAYDPTCRVIVLTGHGSIEYGVRALTLGAASFLDKPADISHLLALITDGLKQCELRRNYNALLAHRGNRSSGLIVGQSPAMKEVLAAIDYAATNSQAVLITGETGTGKGLCAQAIHKLSMRASSSFVRYQPNFGTADLVHSDLFGHHKGSFTGAVSDRKGLLEEAHKGSLFLDEVDELPLETQISLLGVLQDKRFRSLGSSKEHEVDVRIVAATNQDPEQALEAGKIRRDFFHRIAHFRIALPPLRDRISDIPLLAAHIVAKLIEGENLQLLGCSEAALEVLSRREWPGNVRQLQAVVEGGAYRAQYNGHSYVEPQDLENGGAHANSPKGSGSFHEQVRMFKSKLVQTKLAETGGNQLQAAKALGLDRSSFRRLLEVGNTLKGNPTQNADR